MDDDERCPPFRPEYMHQIFDDEKIRGYKGLEINIYLNASTLFPFIDIHYEEKHQQQTSSFGKGKSTAAAASVNQGEKRLRKKSSEESNGAADSTTTADEQVAHEADPSAIVDDILFILTKKEMFQNRPLFSEGFTTSRADFLKRLASDSISGTPPGTHLHSYAVESDGGAGPSRTFEIYKADFRSAQAVKINNAIQPLFMFYIQTSWFLNTEDKWILYFLFEKTNDNNSTKYYPVGLCTAYPFWAYPDNERLRISQFMILPPFHRQGHGKQLLSTIYADARTTPSIVEICVEDPVEEFTMLRDAVDLREIESRNYFAKSPDQMVLTPETVSKIRSELKLCKTQIRKCYEILKLGRIPNPDLQPEAYRKYRLEVKRRLFRSIVEDGVAATSSSSSSASNTASSSSSPVDPAEEKKKKLREAFATIEQNYRQTLQRVFQ